MANAFLMQAVKDRPVDTDAQAEATAVLRAQIQVELQNKKQCAYKPYECTQLAINGYSYCSRHILSDKGAPFKQCSFVYNNNGKRCSLPAPKGDKKDMGSTSRSIKEEVSLKHSLGDSVGEPTLRLAAMDTYCNEHALKAHLIRAKQGTRPPPPRTAETLLHSLSHYVRKRRIRNSSTSTQYSDEGGRTTPDETDPKVTKSLDPFVDIDAHYANASRSDVLDMCSESESDVEPATYTNVWQDAQADSSENESIDSEQEDILKHANVYSSEEITVITREKLIRLQSLYIEQYHHLQHVLREKRRKYLQALKREKETCCSISNQTRDNPKEQRMYKKLKAYNHYHRKLGTDAILRKKLNEMRSKITEGTQHKPQSYQTKCSFTEGGVKCTEKALPVARHCRKHILEDPNQVLFRACGKKRSDVECTTPVEAIFEDQTCVLHRDIPPVRSYAQPRKDSESDYEDPADAKPRIPTVKTEIIDYNNSVDLPTSIINNLITEQSSLNMEEDDVDISLINNMYDPPNDEEISKIMDTDNSTLDCPESAESTLDISIKTDPDIEEIESCNC